MINWPCRERDQEARGGVRGGSRIGADALGQLLGGEQAVGSTMARLPWTHLGSIGLSQGLLTGR